MGTTKTIITCEHAGKYVPKEYKLFFQGHEEVLDSHMGWDPGALIVAKYLAKHLRAPLFYHKVSRLVVEVNRSIGHPQLFSRFTNQLDEHVKNHLIEMYYNVYRNEVEETVRQLVDQRNNVLHLSIHSFTPVLYGVERLVDVGILFDDQRPEEMALAQKVTPLIQDLLPNKVVLHNCPYHGSDDGFTSYLRNRFSANAYMGFEIEVNQKYVQSESFNHIKKALFESFSSQYNVLT